MLDISILINISDHQKCMINRLCLCTVYRIASRELSRLFSFCLQCRLSTFHIFRPMASPNGGEQLRTLIYNRKTAKIQMTPVQPHNNAIYTLKIRRLKISWLLCLSLTLLGVTLRIWLNFLVNLTPVLIYFEHDAFYLTRIHD